MPSKKHKPEEIIGKLLTLKTLSGEARNAGRYVLTIHFDPFLRLAVVALRHTKSSESCNAQMISAETKMDHAPRS